MDRLQNYAQAASILAHSIKNHKNRLIAAEIAQSTVMLRKFHTKEDLLTAEAIFTKERVPKIN